MKCPYILQETRRFVTKLFREKELSNYAYHNLDHTLNVVAACKCFAIGYGLSARDLEILQIAAWFHDMGYIHDWKDHEETSARIACRFLRGQKYGEERIEQVVACILATKMPQQPKNRLEKIICEADLINLSQKSFLRKSCLLRVEMEQTRDVVMSDLEFIRCEIKFLSKHRYHLPAVKKHFEGQKAENMVLLQKKLRFYSGEAA